LLSPGGSISEAIEIGRLVQRNLISTMAPVSLGATKVLFTPAGSVMPKEDPAYCKGPDCICASACFLIWVGGIERSGNAIGLHRPYLDPDVARSLNL
jgi:hypothetical protein